ncbi:MoaD/ThiS family protein [Myxococcota bacterium]|nr:MoaD/ThiS family protein [Myxococcota bacterium]
MSVDIAIPTALRGFTGGLATVTVQADTVGQALTALTQGHPKLSAQLRDKDGKLRSFVNVYLNDEDIRHVAGGEAASLKAGDSLVIVPSIAGGRA